MDIVKQSVIESADIDYVIQIDDLVVSVLLLCTFFIVGYILIFNDLRAHARCNLMIVNIFYSF